MHSYEIEIKSLLGSKENAENLKSKLSNKYPDLKLVGRNSQLNHYFVGGDTKKLLENISPLVAELHREKLKKILDKGSDLSIRTRKVDDKILFVVKASIDDTTSSNGTARIEFEEEVLGLSLDELDEKLLASGCEVQAKWSRDREEYELPEGVHVCLDRNAGYGYLAEFERVVEDGSSADAVKQELRDLMTEFDVEELPQDRLERMFAHYNEHWRDYYGTDKTFTIE